MTARRIECPAELTEDSGHQLLESIRTQEVQHGEQVVLDLHSTRFMDSRGGAWLIRIAELVREKQGTLRWEGPEGQVAEFIELIEPGLAVPEAPRPHRWPFLERLGGTTLDALREARELILLGMDAIYWMVLAPFEGRGFRVDAFLDEMHEMGVRAVKINTLMNFLLGLTIAMLSAAQLRPFGLDIYVADLVMIAFARELSAIMTAVVISARTGAAIAAEIANMKVQEEIDALNGMGLNVTQFLVAPKLLSLVIVQPCLTAMGMIAGVAGGTVWGLGVLGQPARQWFNETLYAATFEDIVQGLIKAFLFANVIVLVGCHNGLRVKGGSRGVGLMTTRAVVMDIFAIVVIDMLFAAIYYYVLERT